MNLVEEKNKMENQIKTKIESEVTQKVKSEMEAEFKKKEAMDLQKQKNETDAKILSINETAKHDMSHLSGLLAKEK